MLTKCVTGVLIFFLGASIYCAQEKQKPEQKSPPAVAAQTTKADCSHVYKITPEDTARPNPVRFTDCGASCS